MSAGPRKALLTFATGRWVDLQQLTLPNHGRYAARHGYDLHVGDGANDEGRPASWSKVPMFRRFLAEYDECLWVDADAFFLGDPEDVAGLVPPHAAQALATHGPEEGFGKHPNCGLWFVRRSALPMLDLLWQLEVFTDHHWWEQGAVCLLLGYMNLDGSHPKHVRHTYWFRHTHYLPESWNRRPQVVKDDERPKVIHCSGMDMEERLQTIRRYLT
jgi:hypothetical protein